MSKGVMYVDNIRVEYDNEPNVLEVCRKAGVEIPNFCFHSDLSVYGACRMCMVEEEGTGKIDAACTMPPKNELHIRTNTARLLKYRRMIIELLLSAHCRDCTTCEKNRACRLQEMAVRFGIHHVRFDDTREHVKMDFSSPAVTMDLNKCILCGDCVRVCHEVQGVSNLRFAGRGPSLHIATADNKPLSETHCVSCGQCSAVCTTGAITIKNDIGPAWKALQDPQKRVVIQIAPVVRVAIGEAYGLPAGENVLDKLVTALKIMGAHVTVIAPPTLMPAAPEILGADEITSDLDAALPELDVVYMLRIQRERLEGAPYPSLREYNLLFGLTEEREKLMRPEAIVCHPGPVNRGVELDDYMCDHPQRSVILDQVYSGVLVRMAVLYLLLGGTDNGVDA